MSCSVAQKSHQSSDQRDPASAKRCAARQQLSNSTARWASQAEEQTVNTPASVHLLRC